MDFNYNYKSDPTVSVALSELQSVTSEMKLAHKFCKAYNKYHRTPHNVSAPCRDFIVLVDTTLTSIFHAHAESIGIIGEFAVRPTLLNAIRKKAATY